MSKKRIAKLNMALQKNIMVWFLRPFDTASTQGYVLDLGPRFFLMATFGTGFQFDGFQCLRYSDIRKLEVPFSYAKVTEAVLAKRKTTIPAKPQVDVSNLQALLLSADQAFPFLVICREKVNPDTCEVGRLLEVDKTSVTLFGIGPDAKWQKKPTKCRLSEITQISFGGDYELGLHQIAGRTFPLNPRGNRITQS
jgi:hypothetical protein